MQMFAVLNAYVQLQQIALLNDQLITLMKVEAFDVNFIPPRPCSSSLFLCRQATLDPVDPTGLIRKAGAVCLERTGFQLTSMINNHDKALLSSRPDDAKI
ncbi:hypothetical protein D917_01080 [Trichinella nativa]|uniref:Uncharacterized protein n=1 Tax=Trichinella nativa TaxID=6335 RepID=A0A1Y3EUV2_9BILA|nr:hypothetical protein D917_01080 [Trichinella nativa]